MPGNAGGKLPLEVVPRGLVATSRIFCLRSLAAFLIANPFRDILVDESGVIGMKPGSICGL